MERLRAGSNTKGWLFTILRNVWLNQLRKWRDGPQMIGMDVGDGIANSVAEPSKDSHDLYVSKLEAEQVRAAIQKLPVEFREVILLREYEGPFVSGDREPPGLPYQNRDVALRQGTRETSCVALHNIDGLDRSEHVDYLHIPNITCITSILGND
jgi:hypothetical protein